MIDDSEYTDCSVEIPIGHIGNAYGGLHILQDEDGFFWCIENWSGMHWEEIPESLFQCLKHYEENRLK